MPASDPTTDVPTPTGTLQGVAAFSWDGAAWQPASQAGPSVATPTGVLRGVAAFNGGPSWQPSSLAQPGVTTPTGTLDGVAVYAWSGAAWTPPGGTATPSTPHGALRGVAAFNWDGAAWQPASQAGPSVATPYGVLDGVAMFGWSGSAWAAVGAPSLSLDFMTSGVLDPRITFTRASIGTYFDVTGTMQTAAINAPRWDYDPVTHALRGLLIEDARTNVLLNSASLGTQGVAVTAQAYTLSFYGAGTVTMSGAFAGTLVGAGASPTRVQTTFTPAAGTLTCTVTGSVLNAQLEAGSFNTSWIPTTAAAVTRSADLIALPTAAWFSTTASSWVVVADAFGGTPTNGRLIGNSTSGVAALFLNSNLSGPGMYDGSAAVVGTDFASVNVVFKAGSAVTGGVGRVIMNGGVVTSGAQANATFSGFNIGSNNGIFDHHNGHILRATYWPRALSNAELQAVTT